MSHPNAAATSETIDGLTALSRCLEQARAHLSGLPREAVSTADRQAAATDLGQLILQVDTWLDDAVVTRPELRVPRIAERGTGIPFTLDEEEDTSALDDMFADAAERPRDAIVDLVPPSQQEPERVRREFLSGSIPERVS